MASEVPKGYFLDKEGRLQKDRRKAKDRRHGRRGDKVLEDNRRQRNRRQSGMEMMEQEHQSMIDDALENFGTEDAEETME